MSDQPTFRYLAPKPGGNSVHRAARWLTGHGVSLFGSRLLRVRGRTSGEWRTTLVNLLEVDGVKYLVAPRGHTQWVRNLRAAGSGELVLGRQVTPVRAEELPDGEKIPILRAYLKRFGWEVGMFFDNLDKNSPDEDLGEAAPGFPAFRLSVP
ncbi:nitroreductase/quinone reductase family protein [Actinopolymorpha sp. B11F2]|uniref:nitroreductase/quinone reductase family protein n=1 Tax=Actinopolymorpha sp. B11F2 TaxID=3160862 RepID=UPI0032E39AB3